jgi:hypothetical protein
MHYYYAAQGDLKPSSRVASSTTEPPTTMAGLLQRGKWVFIKSRAKAVSLEKFALFPLYLICIYFANPVFQTVIRLTAASFKCIFFWEFSKYSSFSITF